MTASKTTMQPPALAPCDLGMTATQTLPNLSGDAYRDSVLQLAALDSPDIISNGLPEHAAVIFEVFFNRAVKSINIFCNNLNPRVFSSPVLIEAFEKALERNVSVRILSQEEPLRSLFSEKLADWASRFPLSLYFKVASPTSFVKGMDENFAVVDSKAYRFEPLKGEGKATASMNSPAAAVRFDRIFETLFAAP